MFRVGTHAFSQFTPSIQPRSFEGRKACTNQLTVACRSHTLPPVGLTFMITHNTPRIQTSFISSMTEECGGLQILATRSSLLDLVYSLHSFITDFQTQVLILSWLWGKCKTTLVGCTQDLQSGPMEG